MVEPRTPGPFGLKRSAPRRPVAPAAPTKKAPPGPIGVGAKSSTAPAAPSDANLGAHIVAFAASKSGQRVGDGQCFALVDQALRSLGARSAADFGTVTANADYKWGTPVALADVQPGDIVQFRNFKSTRRNDAEDGSGNDFTDGRSPHHTAIVVSVDGNGLLTVIEQNAPKGSPVHKSQFGFANTSFVKDKVTTTITTSGSVWFYRPQPK
jgi:CHAP domain